MWDRGGSVGQRAQRGAEACAPGDPGSGRATVPTRSACRYSLWGRKEVERAGRSMERCAGLWMRRRPWLLVFSAASLRSVPVLSWLAVLICELWSFLRALQIKSGMVYDSRWIGWDKLRTYLGVKGHSRGRPWGWAADGIWLGTGQCQQLAPESQGQGARVKADQPHTLRLRSALLDHPQPGTLAHLSVSNGWWLAWALSLSPH